MRSADEIFFRARQEIGNLYLWATAPAHHDGGLDSARLPDARQVAQVVAATPFAGDVITIADGVLEGRIPISGTVLDVGPEIDWRRDYRHNISSPVRYFRLVPYLDFERVGDHKAVWDLNRHQHLVALAQAFLLTSNRQYLVAIEGQIRSWFKANPYQSGINWTSALEVAFRALSWTWVLHLVGADLDSAVRRQIVDGLFKHGKHLQHNLSVYFSPNTHLLGEAVVLHALGVLFPAFPSSAAWTSQAAVVVEQQMSAQVRDDGSHFEESAYYHVYALDLFFLHALLADTSSVYRAKLWRMADYLQALLGPGRRLPMMGDDDGGRVFHPYGTADDFARATLATSAILLDEKGWAFDEPDTHSQALWWLGPRAAGRSQGQVALSSRNFGGSGITVMTTPRADVIFDAGAFGRGSGGHSHTDALSVVVRSYEGDVLIDPGTYTYVSDQEMRRWFRGSIAHNTVRVDGHDQALDAGPFRWSGGCDTRLVRFTSADDTDVASAVCRYECGGKGTVEHRRDVLLFKQHAAGVMLLIRDEISGLGGEHLVEQIWHPAALAGQRAANHLLIGDGAELLVPDGSTFDVTNGWRSRAFGEKGPAPVLIVRQRAPLPIRLWACVRLGASGSETASFVASEDHVRIAFGDSSRLDVDLRAFS